MSDRISDSPTIIVIMHSISVAEMRYMRRLADILFWIANPIIQNARTYYRRI
jgi:hypothetical protein